MRRRNLVLFLAAVLWPVASLSAQGTATWTPMKPGSDNFEVIGHRPLGPQLSVADMELEQEVDRPYAYVARMQYGTEGGKGMDIVDLSDPADPQVIYEWRIENQDLHLRTGGMDVKYFKSDGRYYVVQSLQFGQGGPNSDLGAVVLDVTGLPDASQVREVARIREPEMEGGFHNIFIYKHSSGKPLLLTTIGGPFAQVYDLERVVAGDVDNQLAGQIPVPESPVSRGGRGYHDFYAGYHPETGTDRFYGGGTGGYYVYDFTDISNPELMVTLTNVQGVQYGHTFTPSPDGRYVIAETEYQYAPLRIFDLQPALDHYQETGQVQNVNRPISAWTASWDNLVHNHEVRWPYVFVSGYLDGVQVFSLMDPKNPVTVGYYDTFIGPPNDPDFRYPMFQGTFGVDVRNEDGLIVVSDMSTGIWTFKMDGFSGWNGEWWGMPNISSVQDWDRGPSRPVS